MLYTSGWPRGGFNFPTIDKLAISRPEDPPPLSLPSHFRNYYSDRRNSQPWTGCVKGNNNNEKKAQNKREEIN